jgi:hypothetical protein
VTKIYHRTYARRRQEYDRIRDCIEGELRLKEAGQLYLRRPSGMTSQQYHDYLLGASFFAVAERTLRGLVGAATRHEPILELPPRLAPMRDAATFEGNSLQVLIEQALTEVLSVGRFAMVLDYPTETSSPLVTPHIATFEAEHILDWKEELVDGRQTLTMLRLHENNVELEDEGVEQHLLLTLEPAYTVRRLHVTTKRRGDGTSSIQEVEVHDPITPEVNGRPLFEIPVVIVSPFNLKADVEKPPFLDLVNCNLAHWRNSADYEHALYLTAQPTPWIAGSIPADKVPTTIGSGALWHLPEGATCGMLEFTGAGIAAQKAAMEDKVSQMAALGARMVYSGKGRNETSDTASLRVKDELSLLHSSVVMVEAALRKLLRIAAEWTQPGTADQVVLKMHRDFTSAQMDPATLTALIKAWQAGAISHDTLLMNMKRGDLMDVNRALDDEKELIETDDRDPILNVIQGGHA